ncbi:hypothetical protein HA466_0279800 [Hirschfeldia incana]|nr:hypothetical protein HA466_0279800 [Hirschfeldia incana]
MSSPSPEPSETKGKKKGKKKRKARTQHEDDEKDHKKPKYSPTMWASSSSESEYEGLYLENQLYVSGLPRDSQEKDVFDFFDGAPTKLEFVDVFTEKNEFVDCRAGVFFDSSSATKQGLKLSGKEMQGNSIYVARRRNNREIVCVSGFNKLVPVNVIAKELRRKFHQRGKILNIFLPEDSTGSSLGFGYIFIDVKNDYEDLIRHINITGVQVHIRRATPKLCYRAEMEGKQQPVLEKGSDQEKKIALKKKLLPIPANLHNSGGHQKRFSWRKDNPDLIPETPEQEASECWAIGLHKGHSASCKQAGLDVPVPTTAEIVAGVDAAYQVSGDGISSLKHAATFMKKYCKEIIVSRRPRGDDVDLFEDFERFLVDTSSKIPVMVTVECIPGFQAFNGHGIYRPSDIDCYLRTFEKFPVHCLFLTGNDIDEDEIEFWQLQETWGKKYGDDEGYIKMERHKCLIKSVVVFEH